MTSLSKSSSNSSWMLESCVARWVWVCLPSSLLQAKMALSLSLVFVSIQWAVTPRYDFLLADQQSAVVATNAAALILLGKKKKKKRLSQGKLWWSSEEVLTLKSIVRWYRPYRGERPIELSTSFPGDQPAYTTPRRVCLSRQTRPRHTARGHKVERNRRDWV